MHCPKKDFCVLNVWLFLAEIIGLDGFTLPSVYFFHPESYLRFECFLDEYISFREFKPEVFFASPVSGTDSAGMEGSEDWEGHLARLGHFREERLGAGQGEGLTGQGQGLTGQGEGWEEASRGLSQEQVQELCYYSLCLGVANIILLSAGANSVIITLIITN